MTDKTNSYTKGRKDTAPGLKSAQAPVGSSVKPKKSVGFGHASSQYDGVLRNSGKKGASRLGKCKGD